MRRSDNELENLLGDLRTELGFCLPRASRQKIVEQEHSDSREFAFEVLRAEGFDHPEYEFEWVRCLMERFDKGFPNVANPSDFKASSGPARRRPRRRLHP